MILTTLLIACTATAEVPQGMAGATFVGHCYSIGASTLGGKPDFISVDPVWSSAREGDRVIFNSEGISITQLENWLKEADTYISPLETSIIKDPAKEITQ